MGQQLVKRETSPETKALSDEANRPATDSESQDDVFGLNDSDVNQNKNRSNKSETAGSAPPSTSQNAGYWPRPHLARLFSRDAPGREDNTFKERPSESDELHTIEEAGAGASENAE